MTQATIATLLVGKPQTFGTEGAADPLNRPWTSGIVKRPARGPVWLSKTNLHGDGQADLRHHGGPDKAVLVYAACHYTAWERELQLPNFGHGGFGENFTVTHMTEEDVCIGDTYRVGEAVVQVSQPRQPCWKLARRWHVKDLALRTQKTGRTGWYLRVLEEGNVAAGASITLLERPYPEWTVAYCNEIMHERRKDSELAGKLAACPLLAASWVKTLSKRATAGEQADERKRTIGPNEDA